MASKKEMPHLNALNDNVYAEIFKYLDYKSIVSLRKVSQTLRGFTVRYKPDTRLTTIQIEVNNKDIMCYFEDDEVEYKYRKGGCSVGTDGDDSKILKKEDFRKVMLDDLEIILSSQKTTLDEFTISFEEMKDYKKHGAMIINGVTEILSSIGAMISTKKLTITIGNEEHFMGLLNQVEPSTLKDLELTMLSANTDVIGRFSERLVETPQFQNLENLDTSSVIEARAERFAHLKDAAYWADTVTPEEMMFIGNNFYNRLGMERLRIRTPNEFDTAPFLNLLPEPATETPGFSEWYFESKDPEHIFYVKIAFNNLFFEMRGKAESMEDEDGEMVTFVQWPANNN